MFDYSYERDFKSAIGGEQKMAFLVSGLLPKSGLLLPALLKELTEVCAVRYEEHPPHETDLDVINERLHI